MLTERANAARRHSSLLLVQTVLSSIYLNYLFQTFHHRRPSFSGCRLTDLELTTRHSRFGINTAVVPAPIENFFYFNDPLFIRTVIVVSQ